MRNEFKKLAEQLNYKKLVEKYADPEVDDLPSVDEYLDEMWEDRFDPKYLDPSFLKMDIILYAYNLILKRR